MFCRHCGAAVAEGAQFCARCGNRFVMAAAPPGPGYYAPPAGVPVYAPPQRKTPVGLIIGLLVGGVVLVSLLLIAIAIPTFLGAQDRARDRGAQSDLRNALTAAKTVATNTEGRFIQPNGLPMDASFLQDVEPSLVFGPSGAQRVIGVQVDDDPSDYLGQKLTRIHLWTQSESGTWFGIMSTTSGRVGYCTSPTFTVTLVSACTDTQWRLA